MKAKILNPFLDATVSIIKEVSDISPKRGSIELKKNSVLLTGIAAIVGITGDLGGRVLIDFEVPTALKIASIMNMEEFTEINDLVRSTIQELANMISGRAITTLNNMGFTLDITPPTICEGKDTIISNTNLNVISVPFTSEIGSFIVNLAVIEIKDGFVFMDKN
jgi:chemotaxis protein CheX